MGVQVDAFSLSYSSLLPIFSHNVIQRYTSIVYILPFSIDLFTVTFIFPFLSTSNSPCLFVHYTSCTKLFAALYTLMYNHHLSTCTPSPAYFHIMMNGKEWCVGSSRGANNSATETTIFWVPVQKE